MKKLKKNAKICLKGNYLKFFLISIITFISVINIKPVFTNDLYRVTFHISYGMLLLNLFILPPFAAGVKKVYLTGEFKCLFNFLNKQNIVKSITVNLIRMFIIFTLSIIFILPGIYAAIKLIFVPYVFADNTDTDVKSIFVKSVKLTKGNNIKIIKFLLSFAGWYLLGILTLGTGILFVNPYFEMTLKELYMEVKNV